MTRVSPQLRRDAFATRAAFVADASVNTLPNGYEVVAGGYAYRRNSASTALPDKAGWDPVAPYHLEHWGIVTASTAAAATTDYTTQVQAAFNAAQGDLLFTGWVHITDAVTLPATCRLDSVRGRDRGGFAISTDFNLAAAGVLILPVSDGCEIARFGFEFTQAAATASGLRSDLVAYPPAINMGAATRATLGEIRILRGIDGIVGEGNCGGAKIDIIESSCFGRNVVIDGALDFVHVESIHVWPFGFADNFNLTGIFYDGIGRALVLKKCDGWVCDKLGTFRVPVEIAYPDTHLPAVFDTVQLDGNGSDLLASVGRVMIGKLYATRGTHTGAGIQITGANVNVGQIVIASSTDPEILVSAGRLAINGGTMTSLHLDRVFARVTGGDLSMTGVVLSWPSTGGARTVPMIDQIGGWLNLAGCHPTLTTPTSPVIAIATDSLRNFVDASGLQPHTMALPVGALVGDYRTGPLAPLATYADNAAAVSAGLPVGRPYKTATGEVRVRV